MSQPEPHELMYELTDGLVKAIARRVGRSESTVRRELYDEEYAIYVRLQQQFHALAAEDITRSDAWFADILLMWQSTHKHDGKSLTELLGIALELEGKASKAALDDSASPLMRRLGQVEAIGARAAVANAITQVEVTPEEKTALLSGLPNRKADKKPPSGSIGFVVRGQDRRATAYSYNREELDRRTSSK